MHLSEQNLLLARAELTFDFERKLQHAQRFGPPERLMQRVFDCRLEWLQMHCLLVWRALVSLQPETQNLRELELELRCWEKARRLRLVSPNARKFFSAWRAYAM